METLMFTASDDLAREIGVSRRAEARESVSLAVARLANRERRMRRRIARVDSHIAGQPFKH